MFLLFWSHRYWVNLLLLFFRFQDQVKATIVTVKANGNSRTTTATKTTPAGRMSSNVWKLLVWKTKLFGTTLKLLSFVCHWVTFFCNLLWNVPKDKVFSNIFLWLREDRSYTLKWPFPLQDWVLKLWLSRVPRIEMVEFVYILKCVCCRITGCLK